MHSGDTTLDSGRKRTLPDDGNDGQRQPDSGIPELFRTLAVAMDTRVYHSLYCIMIQNDRHERLVKISRDITMKSKRVIFALQRLSGASESDRVSIMSDCNEKLAGVHMLLKELDDEVSREPAYFYQYAVMMVMMILDI